MKVRSPIKPICEKCKIVGRKGRVMAIRENPRHKQEQGWYNQSIGKKVLFYYVKLIDFPLKVKHGYIGI